MMILTVFVEKNATDPRISANNGCPQMDQHDHFETQSQSDNGSRENYRMAQQRTQ